MIYLASPYSDPDPAVQEERFRAVCCQAAEMMGKGLYVFSPVAHCHPIAAYGLPRDYSYWKGYNLAFLTVCTELVVLKLPGWEVSEGVTGEIALAKELGKPVRYVDA